MSAHPHPFLPLLGLFARLPLPVIHGIGAALGVLSLMLPRPRRVIGDNLRQAGLYSPRRLLRCGAELGKGMLELPAIWMRPLTEVTGWVRATDGWEHVEAARAAGRGMILLGPHLGCLELAGLYVAARMPITALYRRPRQDWVHAMMMTGRARGQARMVEPDLRGVRALRTALRNNEAAWVLPDQKANRGDGQWLKFLGRWAYLPTLAPRLRDSSGAAVLLFHCRRLAWGRGFHLTITPLDLPADDLPASGAAINAALETLIRALPEQYLWLYQIHRLRGDDVTPDGERAQGTG